MRREIIEVPVISEAIRRLGAALIIQPRYEDLVSVF